MQINMEDTENPIFNETLSSEQIMRSDLDLKTIAQLTELAEQSNMVAVIGGGYATEAHCGGIITRPHGDIDITYYGSSQPSTENIATNISSLLSEESTQWKRHFTTDEQNTGINSCEHIEFRETDKDLIPFSERRRVEIEVYTDTRANKRFEKKNLIDSTGKEIEINVTKLSYLVAEKIQRLFETSHLADDQKNKFGRNTTPTDYKELIRLISLPNFTQSQKEESLNIIKRRLNRKSNKEIDINSVFNSVVSMLTPYISAE